MTTYDKLRPWTEIEACQCETVSGLVLVDLLTDNPIHCASCRREIDPERLELADNDVEAIHRWYSVASALYRLWLDSGEYADYAKQRLLDPLGETNRRARELAIGMSVRVPTRFWFFHDEEDGDPTRCPVCGERLEAAVGWGVGICRPCYLQM